MVAINGLVCQSAAGSSPVGSSTIGKSSMDRADIRQIKRKYRVNYSGRLAWSVVMFAVVLYSFGGLIAALSGAHLAISLVWIALVETESRVIFIENLRFVRIGMDAFLYTMVIYITGGTTSFCLLSYIIFIMMTSLYATKRYGIFAIVTCVIFFNAMTALIYLEVLPPVNILAGDAPVGASINIPTVALSNFILILVSVIMHISAHSLYASLLNKSSELEVERNKLKARNATIESELAMARSIQDRIIPAKVPADYIHVMYKPMDQVGGDFFDFIYFGGTERTGIFLSDVSGHGVPAAFITSMIKTLLLQAGTRVYDPAELLRYMNDVLVDQTAGNFVTAFYGIVDPDSKSIVYSNAGHPHPYVITPDSIMQLSGGKCIPMAIVQSDNLHMTDIHFNNSEDKLPEGGKLLLYTDGLTEANHPGDRTAFFENGPLQQAFHDLSRDPGEGFLCGLYSRLVEFRGQDNFEDDICLICVET